MKRLALIAVASALLLTGCNIPDTFKEECEALGGSVLSDSAYKSVTTYANGSVGVGSVTLTVRLCVVDGDVVDMEVW